jgi:hypothetical protein
LMLLFVSGISILSFRYSFLFLKFVIRLSKDGNRRIAGFSTTRNVENMRQEWKVDSHYLSGIQAYFVIWGD